MTTSKSRKILYLCNTYVEADNIAPLIDLVRTCLPEFHQGICILQPGKTVLDTEILPLFLEGVEILTPSEIVRRPTRTFIGFLMRLRQWLNNCVEIERLSFFRRPLRLACRLVMSLRYVLLQSSGVDFRQVGKYEVLIAAAGIYDAILDPSKFDTSRRAEAYPLREIIQRKGVRVVLLPETYDQFTPSLSKNYVVAPIVKKRLDSILVVAGYETGCRSVLHPESQETIGCPRYTEEWCRRIARAAVNPIGFRKKSDREVYLLYLPMRVTPSFPIFSLEEAARVDALLCNVLITHSQIRLLIKQHPKVVEPYQFVCDLTEVPTEQIEHIDGKVDTARLASGVDLVISPGSSVLAQFLWESIPVVLLDTWLQKQEYNYVYAPWCFKEAEFSALLTRIIAGEKGIIKSSSAKQEMMEFFQLGMPGQKYKEQLVTKIVRVTN